MHILYLNTSNIVYLRLIIIIKKHISMAYLDTVAMSGGPSTVSIKVLMDKATYFGPCTGW